VRLHSLVVLRLRIVYQHGRSLRLFGMVMFLSPCPGCVSGCVHTLVYADSKASRRGVYPSGASLMVLGACGYCGVTRVWVHVFPLDRDDMTVKALLTAKRIRFGCVLDTGYTFALFPLDPQRATRFCYRHEQGVYIQQRFVCCCCAFGHCAWVHPAELRELIDKTESPGILKIDCADSHRGNLV